jgi:hypothetical protein
MTAALLRRYLAVVLETRVYRVPVADGIIHVMHNPSKQAFQKFAAERGNNLRGLLTDDGQNLYLWDAYNAVHQTIIEALGIEHENCIAYRNDRWHGPNLVDEETGRYQPAIERITPRAAPDISDEELLRRLGEP